MQGRNQAGQSTPSAPTYNTIYPPIPIAIAAPEFPGPNLAGIPKLNNQNFLPWKRRVTILLRLKGLQSTLVEDNTDEIKDMQAIMILLNLMDDALRIQVQAEPAAKLIMASLERQYDDTSAASKHRLISEFFNFKKDPLTTINQHVSTLKEKRAVLTNMKETVSDDLFRVIIINSLPEMYGDLLKE